MTGFAGWMKAQAQEELTHSMRFYNFIQDRSGRVELAAIQAPPVQWKSAQDAFESAYKHELHITSLIDKLVDLAQSEKDHATFTFLQWFVAEQVEEEAQTDEIVQQIKLVGDSGHALLLLDRELGKRAFAYPANLSAMAPGA